MSVHVKTAPGPCPHALQLWRPQGTGVTRAWVPYTVPCRHDAGHKGPHRDRKFGGERW